MQACHDHLFAQFDYLRAKMLVTDFEGAIINAAVKHFLGVEIKHCYFHLGPNLSRKIPDRMQISIVEFALWNFSDIIAN